jgi:hypothetical protein
MGISIKHIPHSLEGAYEHWQIVDDQDKATHWYSTEARAIAALAALQAGQEPPAPIWPEPGHGQRTCHYCGMPIKGRRCEECV